MDSLIIFLLVGLAAGWLAGFILKRGSHGLVADLIIGCIGSFVGSFIFNLIGLHASGLLGRVFCGTVGAIVLVFLIRFLNKQGKF